MRTSLTYMAGSCLFFAATAAFSQPSAPLAEPSYADIADAGADAPLAIRATIRKVTPLPKEIADRAPAGQQRVLIQARVVTLIRGESGLPRDISYLYDAPVDTKGRLPKLVKREVLLMATPVAARPGQVVLAGRHGQIDWSQGAEAKLKAIVGEVLSKSPPPRVTGVGDAFHVQGTVAGESETQIFLKTRTGEPVSLSILRRPGTEPIWSAAVGEIVDESAVTPTRDTLLWYSLACHLPPQLPDASVAALGPADAQAARTDYALVIQSLGSCDRVLTDRVLD